MPTDMQPRQTEKMCMFSVGNRGILDPSRHVVLYISHVSDPTEVKKAWY